MVATGARNGPDVYFSNGGPEKTCGEGQPRKGVGNHGLRGGASPEVSVAGRFWPEFAWSAGMVLRDLGGNAKFRMRNAKSGPRRVGAAVHLGSHATVGRCPLTPDPSPTRGEGRCRVGAAAKRWSWSLRINRGLERSRRRKTSPVQGLLTQFGRYASDA